MKRNTSNLNAGLVYLTDYLDFTCTTHTVGLPAILLNMICNYYHKEVEGISSLHFVLTENPI